MAEIPLRYGAISAELGYRPPRGWFALAIVGGPKFETNLQQILRLAVNFQANVVFLVGTRAPVKSSPMRAWKSLPIVALESLPRVVGASYVFVDFHERAEELMTFRHPDRAVYVLGVENGTVIPPEGAISVFVPTWGPLNLAVAVGVLFYDRWLKAALR